MSQEEQQQFSTLRTQLDSAHKDAEQIRNRLLTALDQSHNEARFYQGIFWCALAIAAVVAIFGLLRK
jgi:hypothetical protein